MTDLTTTTAAYADGSITLAQFRAIAPHAPAEALEPLNVAMHEASITTPARQAAFLAQAAHESDQFRALVEQGDGHRYEGRRDLGNTQQGDGPRFRGRGVLQLTGRANYTKASAALGVDLVGHPELAAQLDVGARIAAWYWTTHGLNALADEGDFVGITRAVNGGVNGLDQREAFYKRACAVLQVNAVCGG